MTKFKNLIFIALLVLLFVEVLIVFPKRLEKKEADAIAAAEQSAANNPGGANNETKIEQKMGGVHLVESQQQGGRDWELFSQAAEGSQAGGAWKLKGVRVFFYNKEKVEFTVTGDEGSIDAKTKNINIVGKVETRSENGYSFKTASVYYDAAKRIINSPEQVLMQGPRDNTGGGLVLKGGNMTVDVDKSQMLIQNKVSAKKPAKEGKTFEVVADGAQFSGKSKEAKFLGSVRITYDNMKLEGPQASFLYSSGANMLSSVSIDGGVKVSDVNKFATADRVNLDLLANTYVFKGNPKVIQDKDELSGQEIIFLDGGKRVKVEKMRAKMENKD
jgi:LPS export ABC transporter protein LptC